MWMHIWLFYCLYIESFRPGPVPVPQVEANELVARFTQEDGKVSYSTSYTVMAHLQHNIGTPEFFQNIFSPSKWLQLQMF